MPELVGVRRNLWMTRAPGGFKRVNFSIDGLVLYAPLWHPELSGSPFLSKDLNAHSCTVVGATWGLQGRTFDGKDDLISIPNNNVFQPGANDFTISIWLRPGSAISVNWVYCFQDSHYASREMILRYEGGISLILYATSDGVSWDLASGAFSEPISKNVWSFITLRRLGASVNFYQNCIANASTLNWGTTALRNAGEGLFLGSSGNGVATHLNGILGEYIQNNRGLSLGEIQHSYQATKWRYS